MDRRKIVEVVLELYPRSYAEEMNIHVWRNNPAPLYRWLVCALLFSARIDSGLAMRAAKALFSHGWRTPQTMAASTWEERVRVLNRSGYARYDESTSRYIGDTTKTLLDRYEGDLRLLREKADCKPGNERKLIKEFKGIGDVGADIFFRQAQLAWNELFPFADSRALDVAKQLGIASAPEELPALIEDRRELPRLLAALVRARSEGRLDEIRTIAA